MGRARFEQPSWPSAAASRSSLPWPPSPSFLRSSGLSVVSPMRGCLAGGVHAVSGRCLWVVEHPPNVGGSDCCYCRKGWPGAGGGLNRTLSPVAPGAYTNRATDEKQHPTRDLLRAVSKILDCKASSALCFCLEQTVPLVDWSLSLKAPFNSSPSTPKKVILLTLFNPFKVCWCQTHFAWISNSSVSHLTAKQQAPKDTPFPRS